MVQRLGVVSLSEPVLVCFVMSTHPCPAQTLENGWDGVFLFRGVPLESSGTFRFKKNVYLLSLRVR